MFSFLHFLFFFLASLQISWLRFFLAAGEFHCIYAHLAILSTVKGHSGCLHFLAIMYKVAMPGAERASVEQVSVSISICQAVVQLGPVEVLLLAFWELCERTVIVSASVCTPTNHERGLPFACILTTICCHLFVPGNQKGPLRRAGSGAQDRDGRTLELYQDSHA